ncbi:hypothetical protein [Streptomyces sp. NPDC002540]
MERLLLPGAWPDETFGLAVLPELLYYFTAAETADILDRAMQSLEPGRTLELVHWRHHPALVRIAAQTAPGFLLNVFTRPQQPGTQPERLSIAAVEGLT